MIIRLLILIGLAWLGWQFVQKLQRQLRKPADEPKQPETFQLTRRCSQCGTYLPADSLSKSGRCGRCSD